METADVLLPSILTALLDIQKNWVSCGGGCVLQGTHRLGLEVSL